MFISNNTNNTNIFHKEWKRGRVTVVKVDKEKELRVRDSYKNIISELGISPFRLIRSAFALMGIIPLLMFSYIIVKQNAFNNLFMGPNALIAAAAIMVSVYGFIYAYNIVSSLIKKLMLYSLERMRSEEEKTELVIAASHDIRSPLTTIKMGLSNMVDGIDGPLNKEQSATTKVCLESVDKLVNYTNELLDISKLSFTRANIKREALDFSKVVEEKFREISDRFKGGDKKFTYKILSSDSNIWADPDKVSKAVRDLFKSVLETASNESKIEVALFSDSDSVRLAVTNRGPQVSPYKLVEMFSKYSRPLSHMGLAGSSKNRKKGIDLSVVKDIIDVHRGHFSLKNISDKCFEFSVVLPRDLRIQARIPAGVA